MTFADQVVVMYDGAGVADRRPEELFEDPAGTPLSAISSAAPGMNFLPSRRLARTCPIRPIADPAVGTAWSGAGAIHELGIRPVFLRAAATGARARRHPVAHRRGGVSGNCKIVTVIRRPDPQGQSPRGAGGSGSESASGVSTAVDQDLRGWRTRLVRKRQFLGQAERGAVTMNKWEDNRAWFLVMPGLSGGGRSAPSSR